MNAPQADALRPYAERYAELGTGPLPTAPVTDPAYFEREREAIFRRVWLNLGREDEIPRPGDYMVKPVEVWNASIVLVRGDELWISVRDFERRVALPASLTGLPVGSAEMVGGVLEVAFGDPLS